VCGADKEEIGTMRRKFNTGIILISIKLERAYQLSADICPYNFKGVCLSSHSIKMQPLLLELSS